MYLALNRVDVAAKELAKLKSKKDDAIPTLLASAWVNVALGKEKLKDAVETYQVYRFFEIVIFCFIFSHLLVLLVGIDG